ncbi:circadian clock protein KaiA [Argonema galeatum]|uniref:circadian clock protein KaiA n=1 Tax=Argonema galeatum TaxID=2942762 RepID=UPI00201151B3|nr:circadian clock protein KaiA [Argonema galeatum A003/A1]
MRSQLFICTFLPSSLPAGLLQQFLSGERYMLTQFQSKEAFLNFVQQEQQQLDCLVLHDVPELLALLKQLHQQGTLLPSVIFSLETEVSSRQTAGKEIHESTPAETPRDTSADSTPKCSIDFYEASALRVSISELEKIPDLIDRAIAKFLELSSETILYDKSSIADSRGKPNLLLQQQQRLAEKLRERLGYLGVYYKRNPKHFFRNIPAAKKHEFLEQLKLDYREIVLNYFNQDSNLNQKIDEFVNTTFFSDIPVTHIVEIHMELMDELSKQLKLEGRSDEVLLDYRLTLIDAIAHLCEMYRRSLPKES